MHFSKILEDDEEYNVIECTRLDNNILLYKENLDENMHHLVKLKDNQYAILFEKGQVLDLINEGGMYTIRNVPNSSFPNDLNDYQVKNNNDKLSIIFFNMDVIINNKFYIKKKYKNAFYGEGKFDFRIVNPIKLFNKVIEVRTYYSREELLEQIRERISKIVVSIIKEYSDEYKFDEEIINASINIFNEYGIKIVSSDLKMLNLRKNEKRY